MFFSGEKRYAETRSGAHFKAQAMGFHFSLFLFIKPQIGIMSH